MVTAPKIYPRVEISAVQFEALANWTQTHVTTSEEMWASVSIEYRDDDLLYVAQGDSYATIDSSGKLED